MEYPSNLPQGSNSGNSWIPEVQRVETLRIKEAMEGCLIVILKIPLVSTSHELVTCPHQILNYNFAKLASASLMLLTMLKAASRLLFVLSK